MIDNIYDESQPNFIDSDKKKLENKSKIFEEVLLTVHFSINQETENILNPTILNEHLVYKSRLLPNNPSQSKDKQDDNEVL